MKVENHEDYWLLFGNILSDSKVEKMLREGFTVRVKTCGFGRVCEESNEAFGKHCPR